MNNEVTPLLIWSLKIAIVIFMAILYRVGGWVNKFYRRYLMPILYGTACSIIALLKHTWHWCIPIAIILFIGALHKGYGKHNDKILNKILLRLIAGALVAVSFIPYAFAYGRWSLYALHCICAISFSILLGTFNETAEGASSEESMIGLGYTLFPIMMI